MSDLSEVEFDYKEELRRVLQNLLRQYECKNPHVGYQEFWSVVGRYTSHGSGYSAELCKRPMIWSDENGKMSKLQ